MNHQLLPHIHPGLFLADGGLETTLVFHEGIELPEFAAFVLLQNESGKETLRKYYRRYLDLAGQFGAGFLLESPTWRASSDWGEKLGISPSELDELNRAGLDLMRELRDTAPSTASPIVVSGCIGPRGDGYDPAELLSPDEAEHYHTPQLESFARGGAEFATAMTMTHSGEAIGILRAARRVELPTAISFTLETDGCLPTGQTLADAIDEVDRLTDRAAAYFMINCAHPSHFEHILEPDAPWLRRLLGLRTNASRRSHQELNEAPDLDAGNPNELGDEHAALLRIHPHWKVLGGCCGTDHRHIACIGEAWSLSRISTPRP